MEMLIQRISTLHSSLFCLCMIKKTKIQTLGTRKVFVFNPATEEDVIIQFRIVERALIPLIGLNDSEILKLAELLRETIAIVGQAKSSVPSTATEVSTLYRREPF